MQSNAKPSKAKTRQDKTRQDKTRESMDFLALFMHSKKPVPIRIEAVTFLLLTAFQANQQRAFSGLLSCQEREHTCENKHKAALEGLR
jgi:hypothetical protein